MNNQGDWVVVYGGTIVEADLLKCLLDGQGIESQLRDENIGMIAPYVSPAGVRVAIRRHDLARARPIVEDYINNRSRRLREV
jgi:hypothetical protein